MIDGMEEFLVKESTGKTKQQIQSDIQDILRNTAKLNQINFDISTEEQRLKTIKEQTNGAKVELDAAIYHLQDVKQAVVQSINRNSDILSAININTIELDRVVAERKKFEAEQAQFLKQQEQLARNKREYEIESKNLVEAFGRLRLEQLEYEHMKQDVPIHQHLRKIQDELNKKGINIDVIKLLSK